MAFFQNAHVPSCKDTPFERDPNCGSTLEIHRGDAPAELAPVVADVKIENDMPNGFQTKYLSTANIYVGTYELWFVTRTRSGPFIQACKRFHVKSPSFPPGLTLGWMEQWRADLARKQAQDAGIGFVLMSGRNLEEGYVMNTPQWDVRIATERGR